MDDVIGKQKLDWQFVHVVDKNTKFFVTFYEPSSGLTYYYAGRGRFSLDSSCRVLYSRRKSSKILYYVSHLSPYYSRFPLLTFERVPEFEVE